MVGMIVWLCGGGAPVHGAAGPRPEQAPMVKLSQYDRAQFCDLTIGADGRLHAVFTDQPAYDKPNYLYYRASNDGGKTWSQPNNLSDDESGDSASFARLVIDGKGRIYAVWKYVRRNELLDGPGGTAGGRLTGRCLEAESWSKRMSLGDAKVPSYSWFAAVDPNGVVHVIWSQMARDAAETQGGYAWYANLVRQTTLDGATLGAVKDVIVPKPVLTKQQIEQMKSTGRYPKYEDTVPKRDGLINLRGYVDARGTACFVAEHPGIQDGPSSQQTGKQLVLWNGTQLRPLYSYEKYQTYNNFNNPPALLVDALGRQHLIRAPEKSEKPCVRDYAIDGAETGDFINIIIPKNGPGKITNWQAHQLSAGKMAVTVAFSEKGGYRPEDLELYISFFDGAGKWSEPVSITRNQGRKSGFHKETGGGNAIGAVYEYTPRFASVATGKDGRACVLLVTSEDTIIGLTSPALTSSGRVVSATGTGRVDSPAVFFLKL